ncbi:hypothetical protein F4780DRAFT_594549 [Xylariomycetidae sp. FL0641]|nr:hypothetical protein F4780DRAFT_594549 [Xylariomycetidae sp. FL0641]
MTSSSQPEDPSSWSSVAGQDSELNQHRSPNNDSGVSVTSDAPDANHADRACEKCRVGKRKCDKLLPECGRCTRLAIPCAYILDTQSPKSTTTSTAHTSPPSQPQRLLPPLLRGHDPLSAIAPSDILGLLDVLGADWRSVADEYYKLVHPWLNVVHPLVYRETLKAILHEDGTTAGGSRTAPLQLSATHALILVMMAMVTRPVSEGGADAMFDDSYHAVKRLLALMTYADRSAPEYVQLLTLMALYEFGHGNSSASYQTLGEAVLIANVLGIRPGTLEDYGGAPYFESVDQEQQNALWWCLFVLDQCIHSNMPTKGLPFLVESATPSTILPAAGAAQALTDVPSHRLPASVGVKAGMGAFQKDATVSYMLHRALRWDYERNKLAPLPPLAALRDLDSEIRASTNTLLQDVMEWEVELDCFSMLVSAIFTLYLPYLPQHPIPHPESLMDPSNTSDLAQALMALRFASQMSVDITCRLYDRVARLPDEFPTLAAPSAAPCCFLATLGAVGLARVFTEDARLMASRIKQRFEGLESFSSRWGIAYSIMDQLENLCGIRKGYYLIPASGNAQSSPQVHMDPRGEGYDNDVKMEGSG